MNNDSVIVNISIIMEHYIPVSKAVVNHYIYPYLSPTELHGTKVLSKKLLNTKHNYSSLFDIHAKCKLGKNIYRSIKQELIHMGIYDTMIYLSTFVPSDTCIPKQINKDICLPYTPNMNDMLYSASIWSSSRVMYHPACLICNKTCLGIHDQKQINIEKVLHEKYMKYPSKWFINLNTTLMKNMFSIGKTLLTKRIDYNNLYTMFDIFLKGTTYLKIIYPELNNWIYHVIDILQLQYSDNFVNDEYITPTKYILSNIHQVIRKYTYKKYFTILVQNTST